MLIGDRVLRVIATHFGLHAVERRLQAKRLMAVLGSLWQRIDDWRTRCC